MHEDKGTRPELIELIDAASSGTLTPNQQAELEAVLLDDASAREVLREFFVLDAQLSSYWERRRALDNGLRAIELAKRAKPAAARESKSNRAKGIVGFFSRPTPVSMTAAAMVIGLLLTAMYFMVPPVYRTLTQGGNKSIQSPYEVVAQVTRTHEPVWRDSQPTAVSGTRLVSGQTLELKSGLIEVTFDDGARTVIEGPVVFRVDSRKSATLTQGKLVARVEGEQAKGFTIETPDIAIVDLGTEFGVGVDDRGGVNLEVFDGKVSVELKGAAASNDPLVLAAGERARWEPVAQGKIRRQSPLPAAALQFTRKMPPSQAELSRVLAHWTFDEFATDAPLVEKMCVRDHSLHGRHAFVGGSTGAPHVVEGCADFGGGTALQFDGGRDVVIFRPEFDEFEGDRHGPAGSRLDFSSRTSFTLEAVIRTQQTDPGAIVAKDWAPEKPSWWFRVEQGRLRFLVCDMLQEPSVSSDAMVSDGRWHHVAAVRDAKRRELRVYIGGRLAGTQPDTTKQSLANDLDVRIGQFNSGHRAFIGEIDCIRISAGALPPAEFLQPTNVGEAARGLP